MIYYKELFLLHLYCIELGMKPFSVDNNGRLKGIDPSSVEIEYWAILSVREDGVFDIDIPDIPVVAACGESETEAIERCQQRLCCELYNLLVIEERRFPPSLYEIVYSECERDKIKFPTHSNWKIIRVCGKPIRMELSECELDAERRLAREIEQDVLNEISLGGHSLSEQIYILKDD